MITINEDYLKLQASYLFSDIAKRVESFQKTNPDKEIIKMGIGDITRALPQACAEAMHLAVDEMSADSTFRGYGPEQGYLFLREKIAREDFESRGSDISPEEVFISDGAKCDTGNFQEILSLDSRVALPDPVYPVYLDTNVMAGRTGPFVKGRFEGIVYLESSRGNKFIPDLPKEPVDLIYLCFPNNPTGAVVTRDDLQKWVDYARDNKALILYDAAYERFIQDPHLPRSIYEVNGAKEVAVEFRSFSKTAGFTGTRCAYTIVPKQCCGYDRQGHPHSLHSLWLRRQSTKFNGVSYPVQRAAEAVYAKQGQEEVEELIAYYLNNAELIRHKMTELGYECVGGIHSPYIWIYGGQSSWEFFDLLLNKAGVVCTPGIGFGQCGEGFIRLSAFNSLDNVQKAMEKIQKALS
ncbi:MAG TPA: LL-diaminopimelate aminotransferase [Desulfohalobiaceae bacterium]|nr:LL-diaminopimelate aminotransferase [Desulfohalobiaceae bacterium]